MSETEYDGVWISRRLLRTIVALVIVCLVGLLVSVVLTLSYAQRTNAKLQEFQAFVEGRGEYRDRESHRLEALIDRVVCDILGEFPTGDPRADRLRERYDCAEV